MHTQVGLMGKDANGVTVEVAHPSGAGGASNEPFSISNTAGDADDWFAFMSNSTQPLGTFNAATPPDWQFGSQYVVKEGTRAAYNAGDHYVDRSVEFLEAEGNRSDWKVFGFGHAQGAATAEVPNDGHMFAFVADHGQTKSALEKLQLTFRTSFARVLTNDGD